MGGEYPLTSPAVDTNVRSILIVGGGSAGWMTATLLNRYLPAAQCRITLVESADIGIIGVGEATIPPLVGYLKAIGVDELSFLRACQATYKLGVKFVDWYRPGTELWHPFGPIGGSIDRLAMFHHWVRLRRSGLEQRPYCAYSLQALLGDLGKSPRTLGDGSSVVAETGGYAYHLDARSFASALKRISVSRGVHHLVDNVRAVTLDERGFIAGVETQANGTLQADLYIDCTGFAGLLIERALGDPWQSWSDQLLCDRAVAMQMPYDARMDPYTRSTALGAGWVWRIPLSQRVGTGYVYSSHFISDDAAREEFVAHAGADPRTSEPRLLRMRVGRRTNFWVRNCVAIGLSAGFLEPLESTGLFLIQGGIERLLDAFPSREPEPSAIALYNRQMAVAYQEVRDFIVLHYILTQRDDTPFWRANAAMAPPDSLAGTLEMYDANGIVDWDPHVVFGETSFYSIAAGFGRLPRRHMARADYSDASKVRQILDTIRARHEEHARTLPSHAQFIRATNETRPPQ